MQPEIDPNTFTQKDLMQHLLHTAQHAVTREEMTAQFAQAEQRNKERLEQIDNRFEQAEQHNKERFEQVDNRFEQAEQHNKERFEQAEQHNKERFEQAEQLNKERFEHNKDQLNNLAVEIKSQSKKHDRLTWALFAGMSAIFFKNIIFNLFTTPL